MISNDIATMNVEQFNNEYKKSQIHFNSRHCKNMVSCNEKIVLTLQHVLVLMIYCNYTNLQNQFSKTYRVDMDLQILSNDRRNTIRIRFRF